MLAADLSRPYLPRRLLVRIEGFLHFILILAIVLHTTNNSPDNGLPPDCCPFWIFHLAVRVPNAQAQVFL
ncbi:hypothetical protein E2C01_037226 [Portunus trituberculatus]|uniref:Uncharacterized protein n=1 Tax=Portunus trituberculatus TaxID=210409 RepID=A0A5B7FDL1_PORTR|nr:hypothetical protein [Portunus trituberculatus]